MMVVVAGLLALLAFSLVIGVTAIIFMSVADFLLEFQSTLATGAYWAACFFILISGFFLAIVSAGAVLQVGGIIP